MRASVIVATYKRADMISCCLDALDRQTIAPLEVLVIDQSPDDATRRMVAGRAKGRAELRYFHSEKAGVSLARNIGLRAAQGEIIAITDDDALPEPGWLAALLRAFDETFPRAGLVGGKVLPVWDGPRPRWFPPKHEFLLPAFNRPGPLALFPADALPMSVNLCIDRRVVERIGVFNENIGRRPGWRITGEDSLFALKAIEAGFPVYYQPDAVVLHPVQRARMGRRSLLERNFEEGICQVDIEEKRGLLDTTRVRRLVAWHTLRTAWWVLALAKYPSLTPWGDPRVFEALSNAATSLGVVRTCAMKLRLP